MVLAADVEVPLVLYAHSAEGALAERLAEWRKGCDKAQAARVAVYDFCGSREQLDALLDAGCYIIVTGSHSWQGT